MKAVETSIVSSLLAIAVSGCGVEGLHSANPTTSFRFDPWSRSVSFTDNKDNDVTVDEITIDGEARTATVKNLKIINNASNVRIANRQQLEGLAIEAEAIGNAWATGIKAGAELATSLVPILGGLSANPIWGTGQAGAVPSGWTYVGPSASATTGSEGTAAAASQPAATAITATTTAVAAAPIDVALSVASGAIQVGDDIEIEVWLKSATPQTVMAAQLGLTWDPAILVIEGATTYVPHFWGGFELISGGANENVADGDAWYVYLPPIPAATLPLTDVKLAAIYAKAVGVGTTTFAVVANTPQGTLTTRVTNGSNAIVTGNLGSCVIDVQALVGDVNDDGIVDNGDLIAVRANRGKAITAETCRYDVNRDGFIDNGDLIAVRARRATE